MQMEIQITFQTLRAALDGLTIEELQFLKQEVEMRLQNTDDWLETEYVEYARQEGDPSISLESVQAALAKIEGSMSDAIIEERKDRF
jgi:hypothetical protein